MGEERVLKRGELYSLIGDLCGVGELTHFWTEIAKKKPILGAMVQKPVQHPVRCAPPSRRPRRRYQGDSVERGSHEKELGKHSGANELKRQRRPVSEFPPGHGFVCPGLLKSQPTFLMVLNDSECFSLGRAAFHIWACDRNPLGEVQSRTQGHILESSYFKKT